MLDHNFPAGPLERKDDSGVQQLGTPEGLKEFMQAYEAHNAKNDARLASMEKKLADPIAEAELKKIDSFLDKYEDLNQRITDIGKKAEQVKEIDERFDELETMLKRSGRGNDDEQKSRVTDWARGVVNAITMGVANLPEEQKSVIEAVNAEYKALNIGTDTAGGYLAPTEMVREMLKDLVEVSDARSIVRLRTSGAKSVEIPKRTSVTSARRVHETGTKTETGDPAFGMLEMPLPESYAMIHITNQMLEDSGWDMEAEIQEEAREQFAVQEGREFISGTGKGEMEGILTNADISENVSGSAATIADADGQANGLLTMKYALKTAYARNAMWLMRRTTIGDVRKLKDNNKNYIWQPGIAQGQPNTIDGDPYKEMPDMPAVGAGAYPIAYGDFRRGYTIIDRIAMEMLRDIYTQATAGQVRFIFRRRFGGGVQLAEAIRKLKCST